MADDQVDQNTTETDENDVDEACEQFLDGQLSYVGNDVDAIPQKLIDEYSKVTRRLDLSFNNISQLTGLEEFCNLEELVLDNNIIDDTTIFPCLTHLHTLTLNKNKLSNIEGLINTLEEKFPNLKYLSLLGNMACPNQLSCHDKDDEDYLRYRYLVLYRLPNLKFLDSTEVRKSDLEQAKRQGPYLTVIRGNIPSDGEKEEPIPTPKQANLNPFNALLMAFGDSTMPDMVMVAEESSPSSSPNYSPLPETLRSGEDHQGTFGKSRYVYYGKHSEGNRFIRNTDL